MLIDISDILKESGLSKVVTLDTTVTACGVQEAECEFGEPLAVAAELTNIKGLIRVKGRIAVDYTTYCARCLKPIRQTINKDIEEEAVLIGSLNDEEEYYSYSGKELDLGWIVRDAILLDIPIRHLCGSDCKALCPKCGKDLNSGPCACVAESGGGLFDALKGFVAEEKTGED